MQDDWKVSRNLTLNLGIRDTVFRGAPNGYDKYNDISDFVPSLYVAAHAPTIASSGAIVSGTGDSLNGIITPTSQKGLDLPRSLTGTRNQIGPSVGFAWAPFGSQSTSIRGGYGIFYHWDNDNHENLSANPPYSQSATIYNTTLTSITSDAQTQFPPTIVAFDPRKLYPTVNQYSLTIERQLPFATVLSLGYVGNTARHLDQTPNINQAWSPRSTCTHTWRMGDQRYHQFSKWPARHANHLLGPCRRRKTPGSARTSAAPLHMSNATFLTTSRLRTSHSRRWVPSAILA